MDEQNINPMDTNAADNTGNPFGTIGTQDPYSMSGSGDPYGMNGTQNPYGAGETQNPYGTNGASNPYGANGTQNPYGADGTQNPYGTNGAQNPYGASGVQNPYGANAAQNPYGAGGMQNPYGTNGAYGSGSVTPPKPPKKKMSKKAKILIFGGIGLAAVAVAAVLLCIYVFFPAKKTVKSALDNMLGSEGITSGSLLFKELGMDTLSTSVSPSVPPVSFTSAASRLPSVRVTHGPSWPLITR